MEAVILSTTPYRPRGRESAMASEQIAPALKTIIAGVSIDNHTPPWDDVPNIRPWILLPPGHNRVGVGSGAFLPVFKHGLFRASTQRDNGKTQTRHREGILDC
jgi:hypothetical protein